MSAPARPGPAAGPRPGHPRAAGRPAGQRRTSERLVALLIGGCVVLNFPLLSVLRGRGFVAGIPALYVYLFLVWAGLAVATALILRDRPQKAEPSGDRPGSREP